MQLAAEDRVIGREGRRPDCRVARAEPGADHVATATGLVQGSDLVALVVDALSRGQALDDPERPRADLVEAECGALDRSSAAELESASNRALAKGPDESSLPFTSVQRQLPRPAWEAQPSAAARNAGGDFGSGSVARPERDDGIAAPELDGHRERLRAAHPRELHRACPATGGPADGWAAGSQRRRGRR